MSTGKRLPQRINLPISERKVLIAAGDLAAINLAVLIALRVWATVGRIEFNIAFVLGQAHWFLILSVVWLVLASANNFYDLALTARWVRSQAHLLLITLQLLIIYLLIFFLSDRQSLPRLFILYYALASYVLIAIWRLGRPFLIGWRPFKQRELVVGIGWAAQALVEAIRQYAPGDYEVVGFIDDGMYPQSERAVSSTEVVGSAIDLPRIARELRINEIVLASRSDMGGTLFQAVMDCYELGIPLKPMPLVYEQLTGMIPVEHVGDNWNIVLPLEGRSPFDPYPMLKRLLDIALSIIGLAIFAVLLPIIALSMMIESPGPIFYRQERVGEAGRIYSLIKLRSMVRDAEAGGGPIWAVSGDSRVTRVGWFLRKSRLDEVPQLWNVLKGEMSLIGPRPERPFFVERLHESIPFYRTRLAVAPGLTGWAQVNYGYGNTEKDALIKLQYDLYYIRHRSLLLDMLILLRTVGRVVRLQGT